MSSLKKMSGISYIEKPAKLSEWAQRKIAENNFSLESVKNSTKFQNFTRSEKDAIRYQLKKSNMSRPSQIIASRVKPANKKIKAHKKTRNIDFIQSLQILFAFGATIFLLQDLANFYAGKGFSDLNAILVAVLVELGIIVGALSAKKMLLRCAYFLFAYNMAVFTMSAGFKVSESIQESKMRLQSTVIQNSQIESLERNIKAEKQKQSQYLIKLDSLFERGIITSSSKAIEKMIEGSRREAEKLENKLSMKRDNTLKNANSEPLALMVLTSLLMLFLRGILQFLSIQCLHNLKELRGA